MKVNLDELQALIKRIDALLSDRQPGLMSWKAMLGIALAELVKMLKP